MKKVFLPAALLCLASSIFIFHEATEKPQISSDSSDPYATLIPHMKIKETDDFFKKMDTVRHFIHANSIHQIDEAFYKTWGDDPKVAALILDRLEGRSAEGPHLECSSRGGIVERVLTAMGYHVRSVIVYKFKDNFPSHVFLEVQNPADGRWSIEDPDYDIYWELTEGGRRAGIEDLIRMPHSAYQPCLSADKCGWDIVNDEGRLPAHIKESMALAVIKDGKDRTTLVNAARFDLHKKLKAGPYTQNFCEFAPKNCKGKMVRYGAP